MGNKYTLNALVNTERKHRKEEQQKRNWKIIKIGTETSKQKQ